MPPSWTHAVVPLEAGAIDPVNRSRLVAGLFECRAGTAALMN